MLLCLTGAVKTYFFTALFLYPLSVHTDCLTVVGTDDTPAVLADTVQVRALNAAIKAASTHITATKNMDDPDGDGVFEMALSVTGSAQSSTTTEVDKSNVIIVMDRSNSMSNNTYVEYVYDADTYDSNTSYYRRGNYGNYERVYYRNGAWRTSNNTIHNGPVYIRTTRINAEQAALDSVVQNLLANNRDEDNLRDIIEISIIGYALQSPFKDDNGNVVAATQISNSNDYDAIMAAVNNDSQRSGTNWDDALREALREANALKAAEKDEAVYIIFLTDGEPTASHGDTNYSTGTANYWKHWGNANTQATAIVDAGYEFFSIFTYGDNNTYINYLNNLTRSAHGVGTYTQSNFGNTNTYHDNFFNATDTSELVEAFEAIVDKINSNVGYAGVSYEDGVTVGVTNTSVTVDGSINTDSFHYTVLNGSTEVYKVSFAASGSTTTATFTIGGTEYTTSDAKPFEADLDNNGTIADAEKFTYYSVTVDGKEYKMAPASMDSDGLIDWELAGLGILENGYTYKLTFDVWPNQLAYDMVADLNNGVKTLSEIEADVVADKGQDTWDQIEEAIQVTYTEDDVEVTDSLVNLTDDVKTAIEKGEIKASYAILTNYTQTVNYYTANEETSETTGETTTTYTAQEPYNPPQPNPISLTSTQMLLEKVWEDSLDEAQLKELLWNDYDAENPSDPTEYKVPLIVWKAETADAIANVQATTNSIAESAHLTAASTETQIEDAFKNTSGYYMTKILGWNEELTGYSWQDTLDVAPGTLITLERAEEMGITIADDNIVSYNGTDYYILESGHYYTVSEIAIDRHFELNTVVYHPMLVNRKVQNVTFTTERDENGHIIIESIVPMSSVDAYNTLKGGINIEKKVQDTDGATVGTADSFKVTVHLTDAEGNALPTKTTADGTSFSYDYRIYYGTNNPNYASSGTAHRSGHIYGTGTSFDAELYVGDVIRVINVENGALFYVEETLADGSAYTLKSIDYTIRAGDAAAAAYAAADKVTKNGQTWYKVKGNCASNATVTNTLPPAFYVYHSSDKSVERIPMTDGRVDQSTGIFNIVNETKTGYIYGGYYRSYGYALPGMTDEEIIAGTYKTKDGKTAYTYMAERSGGMWMTDENGTAYEGDLTSWDKDAVPEDDQSSDAKGAYTQAGTTMVPEKNTVYYLKEVPEAYLTPATYVVYDERDVVDECMQIIKLYQLTATDDDNYREVGFDIVSSAGIGQKDGYRADYYWGEQIDVTKNGAAYATLTADKIVTGHTGLIAARNVTESTETSPSYIVKNAYYRETPYHITPDNVKVTAVKRMMVYVRNARFKNWTKPGMTKTTTSTKSVYVEAK